MLSNNKGSSTGGGIGFFGLLTVCFIVLKITGVIDWHWVWVLSPVWISITIGLIIITSGVVYLYFDNIKELFRDNKRSDKEVQ